MFIILTSLSVIAPNDTVDAAAAQTINDLSAAGWPIGVVSNHEQPSWFAPTFPSGNVVFLQRFRRQDGSVVAELAQHNSMKIHDVIVLGASEDDLAMAKNGGALLVVAGWAANSRVKAYGLIADTPAEFSEVLRLVGGWPGGWFFQGVEQNYTVAALSNVSGLGVSDDQRTFASMIVTTIKQGGPRLKALLAVLARSMLIAGIAPVDDLMFGFYPSSTSDNQDGEVLADFVHRLRSVTSRVRLASVGTPLFVRHMASSKRSQGGGGDRTDPGEQIATIHLNPQYRNKIKGRNVIVIDDCTTYGVSFGVAAAFLRAAGASSVTGIALGKFGGRLNYYDITITADPFQPVRPQQYKAQSRPFIGTPDGNVQLDLRRLLK